MNQSELPYHVMHGGVQSNDTLYGGTKEFMELIEEKCEMVMGRLEDIYKQDREKLSLLAVEILEVILSLGDIGAVSMTPVFSANYSIVQISVILEQLKLVSVGYFDHRALW